MRHSLRSAAAAVTALFLALSIPAGGAQSTTVEPKRRVARVAPKVVVAQPKAVRRNPPPAKWQKVDPPASGGTVVTAKPPKGTRKPPKADWPSSGVGNAGSDAPASKPPKTKKPPKYDPPSSSGGDDVSTGSAKPPKTKKPPKYDPPSSSGGDDVSSGSAKPPKGHKPPKGDKNPPSTGGDDVGSEPPSGDKGDDVGTQRPPKGQRPPRNPKNPKDPKNPPNKDPNPTGGDTGSQEPGHDHGEEPTHNPRPPRRPPIVITIDPFHPSQDDDAKDESKKEKKPKKEKEPKEPETVEPAEPAVDQMRRFGYTTTRCRALAAAMLQAGRIDAAIRLIEILKEQESIDWSGKYSDGTLASAEPETGSSDLVALAGLERELAFWRLSDVRRASAVEPIDAGQKKAKKSKKPKKDEEAPADEARDDSDVGQEDAAAAEDEGKSKKKKDKQKDKEKDKEKDADVSGAGTGTGSWVADLEVCGDKILPLEQEATRLRAIPAANRTPAETDRLAVLEADIAKLATNLDALMARVAAQAGSKDPRVKRLKTSDGLALTLSRLGPGVAAIYTLVADERYWLVLVTPNGKTAYSTPIQAARLNALAMSFRETLTNPKLDPLPLSSQLYDIMLKPVAAELAATRTTTLLWSFDGVLRYVPVAALYDGQGYVVEKFTNVLFTRESIERLLDEPSASVSGVGFGVTSKVGEFNALPAVADELRGIFTDDRATQDGGVVPGKVSIDASFTEAAFEQALQDGYPIVHVATHFQLDPRRAKDSVLLLGDGTLLNVGDISDIKRAFKGTDLLTLSACNTAASGVRGDGKEVECFATIAQDRGARAVIASLWSVNDRSTSAMMQTFYRLRATQPGIGKAEALRRAQEMLLRGTLVMPSGPDPDRLLVHEDPKPTGIHGKFTPDPRAPFAHPYYWAPFTLVGNFR